MKSAVIICGAVLAALVFAGCSGKTGTANTVRYSSAQHVIAAIDRGGLRCTGASNGTPVVSGATSEASCDFGASASVLIDVFPGTVTTAMVLRNSVSTGTQKIWSDVGPNWWVQTSSAYVKRVQKILGGRIIGGPWHPPSATAPSPAAQPVSSPTRKPCSQRVQNWKGTPGAQAINQALAVLHSISADGRAGDFAKVAADLDDLGATANTMRGNSLPSCADPAHYWWKMTRAMVVTASESSGVANANSTAIQQATADTSQFQADAAALISELKQEGLW